MTIVVVVVRDLRSVECPLVCALDQILTTNTNTDTNTSTSTTTPPLCPQVCGARLQAARGRRLRRSPPAEGRPTRRHLFIGSPAVPNLLYRYASPSGNTQKAVGVCFARAELYRVCCRSRRAGRESCLVASPRASAGGPSARRAPPRQQESNE